jgi:phosphatidate cytidylyltransferase
MTGKGPVPGGVQWGDLRVRAISAAVLMPLALFCLWSGGLAWLALVGIAVAGLAREWVRMCRRRPCGAMVALIAGGLLYIAAGGASLLWLRADPSAGLSNVLFLLLLVWATDIGAYIAGRAIGGPKLAPSISPGKTWSGAAGGLAAGLAVAVAEAVVGGVVPGWHGLLVAMLLSVASQCGDLAESAAKRHFGVKDSGSSIPGHGGLFDRLDGVLAAASLAALLAMAIGRGGDLWR